MAASAAAQQSAHAEAELQLIEHLKVVDAALSEARESEQSLRVYLLSGAYAHLRKTLNLRIARTICGMRTCKLSCLCATVVLRPAVCQF